MEGVIALADAIVYAATEYAMDEDMMSPYALQARKEGYRVDGGNQDDAMCIVGVVRIFDDDNIDEL